MSTSSTLRFSKRESVVLCAVVALLFAGLFGVVACVDRQREQLAQSERENDRLRIELRHATELREREALQREALFSAQLSALAAPVRASSSRNQ